MISTIGTTPASAGQAVSTDPVVSVAARGQSGDSGTPVAIGLSTVAAVVLVALAIGLSYFVCRRRKKAKETKKEEYYYSQSMATTTTAGASIASTAASAAAGAATDDEYYYTDVDSMYVSKDYGTSSATDPQLKTYDQRNKATY